MIVAESHRGRRLVGRLDRGDELIAALTVICAERGVRSAELRAFGTVDHVELVEPAGDGQAPREGRPPRRFDAAFTLVHLLGNLSELSGRPHVEATCALSRSGERGIELVGGKLRSARVHAVDFVIDCFDDLVLHRRLDEKSGLLLLEVAGDRAASPSPSVVTTVVTAPALRAPAAIPPVPERNAGVGADEDARLPVEKPAVRFEAAATGHYAPSEPHRPPPPRPSVAARPAPAPAPAAPTPVTPSQAEPGDGKPTWAEVAALSSGLPASPRADGGDEEEPLRPGDVIEHPRFGRCNVERIEGAGDYAQVRLKNRRVVRLSLDVIQLIRDGNDENGDRRYRAHVAT